jgi:hypothetical protein
VFNDALARSAGGSTLVCETSFPFVRGSIHEFAPQPGRALRLLGDQFFPSSAGRDYKASPYLELLQPHRNVSMLQRLGIESDRFASSTGTMKGLEFA